MLGRAMQNQALERAFNDGMPEFSGIKENKNKFVATQNAYNGIYMSGGTLNTYRQRR